jgi:hypothetical protein
MWKLSIYKKFLDWSKPFTHRERELVLQSSRNVIARPSNTVHLDKFGGLIFGMKSIFGEASGITGDRPRQGTDHDYWHSNLPITIICIPAPALLSVFNHTCDSLAAE